MTEPLTVIFFSCRRIELLRQSVWAFINANTYPITDFIIVNDSGGPEIQEELMESFEGATFVFNNKNIGLIASIDRGYSFIKTNYFFHSEDDWSFNGKTGFIEKSMDVMQDTLIEEVWLANPNNHPIEPVLYETKSGVKFRLVEENHQKGMNGFNDMAWHGFTTACGLKRMEDYNKVGPYAKIPYEGTIWHREQAIGEEYHKLGYRTAILTEDYAINIGYGKSEYKTGYEK